MIEIQENGAVVKDGETIGLIAGDTCSSSARIAGVVKGQIRKAAKNPDLNFEVVEPDTATESTAPPASVETVEPPPTVAKGGKRQSSADIVCPIAMDLRYGDKTPEVVNWWFDNHPKEAAEKYRDRKTCRDLEA